jgi:hypothetical protein
MNQVRVAFETAQKAGRVGSISFLDEAGLTRGNIQILEDQVMVGA